MAITQTGVSYKELSPQTYRAGAAIAKGKAVKFGADAQHVIQCTSNTDRGIGWAQCDAAAAEDSVVVAMPGGGAKVLLSETVSAGNDLCSHTDGSAAIVNAEGDQILAQAMEPGVVGQYIAVEVYKATAHAAQSA